MTETCAANFEFCPNLVWLRVGGPENRGSLVPRRFVVHVGTNCGSGTGPTLSKSKLSLSSPSPPELEGYLQDFRSQWLKVVGSKNVSEDGLDTEVVAGGVFCEYVTITGHGRLRTVVPGELSLSLGDSVLGQKLLP